MAEVIAVMVVPSCSAAPAMECGTAVSRWFHRRPVRGQLLLVIVNRTAVGHHGPAGDTDDSVRKGFPYPLVSRTRALGGRCESGLRACAAERLRFHRRVKGTKLSMATERFAAELRSATEARRFVEDELGPAGAGEDTLCHAQLLVTELVTNAARHAHSAVDLTIAGEDGHVRIEARDDSSALPTAPLVDTGTRHRGVQLIEDLSESWGVDVSGDDGKVVWCELASTGLAARLESAERRA